MLLFIAEFGVIRMRCFAICGETEGTADRQPQQHLSLVSPSLQPKPKQSEQQ